MAACAFCKSPALATRPVSEPAGRAQSLTAQPGLGPRLSSSCWKLPGGSAGPCPAHFLRAAGSRGPTRGFGEAPDCCGSSVPPLWLPGVLICSDSPKGVAQMVARTTDPHCPRSRRPEPELQVRVAVPPEAALLGVWVAISSLWPPVVVPLCSLCPHLSLGGHSHGGLGPTPVTFL